MTDEGKPVKLRLTYAGRRMINGKMRHLWTDPDGREHSYSKLAGQLIGGIYEVEADADMAVYPGTLEWTGKRVDNGEWRAADKVAQTQLERDRLERRYAKDDSFELAMEPLRELYRSQRTYAQRSAFTAMVLATMAEGRPLR